MHECMRAQYDVICVHYTLFSVALYSAPFSVVLYSAQRPIWLTPLTQLVQAELAAELEELQQERQRIGQAERERRMQLARKVKLEFLESMQLRTTIDPLLTHY